MPDRYSHGIAVVPYPPEWAAQFESVAADLRGALAGVVFEGVEHVGSTSVPGLAAKPILDIDVIVERPHLAAATLALEATGYVHADDLGVTDREVLTAPDEYPARNVYLCVAGTLHVRNHLAVRDTLRADPELRDRYAAVKVQLASDRAMDIRRYTAGKSAVLQEILALSDLTSEEKQQILELNTRS